MPMRRLKFCEPILAVKKDCTSGHTAGHSEVQFVLWHGGYAL